MDPIEFEGMNEGPIIEGTNFNADNLTKLSNEDPDKMKMDKNPIKMGCGYTVTIN